jgi:signal transduction histidine kinase
MSSFNDENLNEIALIIITDITALNSIEKQKQREKMKTLYFASIAHDLKTPINSISSANAILAIRN